MKTKSNNNKILKTIARIITRLNVGGPAKHTVYLTHFIDKNEYNSFLITGVVEENELEMTDIIKKYSVEPIYVPNLRRQLNPVNDFVSAIRILIKLLMIKPDIIHTHTAKAGTTGRLASGMYNIIRFFSFNKPAKVYHTFHGHTFYGYHSKVMNTLFIIIERILSKFFTTKIVVLNIGQYNDIVNKFMIAPPNNVKIIPLGFNFNEIIVNEETKIEFKKRFNIQGDSIVIAIIGRLTKIKNHLRFLNIALRFLLKYSDYNVKFCIIGDGELEMELKEFAITHKISDYIVWTGNIDNPSLIYSGIDIFCLTSDNEGTPLTILESFYAKVPVISTDAGGVPDLLNNNKGIIVEKDSLDIFAEKIKLLIDDSNIRNEIITNAYDYVVKNHSIEALLKNITRLYSE